MSYRETARQRQQEAVMRGRIERLGATLEVHRVGTCEECGRRISDDTIAHGDLSKPFRCTGKPKSGWRYNKYLTVGVHTFETSEAPWLEEEFAHLKAKAQDLKKSVTKRIEPTRGPHAPR